METVKHKEMLDRLHGDLVGGDEVLTDFEKLIGVVEELARKVEELKGHSHSSLLG